MSSYRPNFRDEPGVLNRSRVRVIDTLETAMSMRETFTKKAPRQLRIQPYSWPGSMQNVGDSLAVAYASDKWKDDGDYELYKHLAESRNMAFCTPGFLSPLGSKSAYPVYGPTVSFAGLPMPKHIAVLGYFEEAAFVLHGPDYAKNARGVVGESDGVMTSKSGASARLVPGPAKGEHVARVTVAHALLGGGVIKWREVGRKKKDEPFLLVYTEPRGGDSGGVHMIVVGKELDVEADGIVG